MKKLIILIFSISEISSVSSQSPVWVNVNADRQLTRYESREQTENKLLSEARLLAIQKGSGITIRSVESMTTRERSTAESASIERQSKWFEEYLQHSRHETAGRIIEEEMPKFTPFERSGEAWLKVDFRARVAIDAGNIDPGFSAAMRTQQPAYRVGDTIRIELESTKNSKLYLFNVTSDGMCTLVWPNQIEGDNNILAGVKTNIPKNTTRYAMVAELPENMSNTNDATYSQGFQELLFALLYRGEDSVFDPATAFLQEYTLSEVNHRLMAIPRSQRYEVMAAFSIVQ